MKNGLIVNEGDNYTTKQINKKKKDNIEKFGLSVDYYQNLKPPKIKTKEWLKVLTVDQILNVKNRFTTSQKLYQLEILRIALVRKRESLYTF